LRPVLQLLLLALPLVSGCSYFRGSTPGAGSQPHYVVGSPYQSGGVWYYPREAFDLDATGLAVVLPDRSGTTADHEFQDPNAMAGAHATLQLPAIARITNLETGLQVLIRINDRGPPSPGRLIGLTRRAADRLGITPGSVARVRMQVENEPSQALRDSLRGGTVQMVASAPRAGVMSEPLAPPAGVAQSTRRHVVATSSASASPDAMRRIAFADLPDTAVRVPARPGQLWLRAGEFGQMVYADQIRSRLTRLATTVERVRQGRSDLFRVRAGPFVDVGAADSALDQAIRAGVTDVHIVVE